VSTLSPLEQFCCEHCCEHCCRPVVKQGFGLTATDRCDVSQRSLDAFTDVTSQTKTSSRACCGQSGSSSGYRQALLARYWRTSEGILNSHSNIDLRRPATSRQPTPTLFLPSHRQPQPCLTTEKSRSRALPASTSSPRMSPRRLAASSCSTRQAHREIPCHTPG
jgi:hypothetical protein